MHILAAIAFLAVFAWVLSRFQGDPPRDPEDRLIHICGGDREQAERLIRFEIECHPTHDRASAAQGAIRRLQRDRR